MSVFALWMGALVMAAPAAADEMMPLSDQNGHVVGTPSSQTMPTFSIFEYAIDGNSLLSNLQIENSVSAFMGEGKTLRDVEAARAALERTYHDAGYMTILVSIPEQSVDSGVVALHVTEATIDKLKVVGAGYTLPSQIRSTVPELAEGKVPNFNKVQTELNALNSGAAKVTPILRAGKTPGTVEVQLDVEDQMPLHGNVEWSNRQTPNTTSQRLSASLRYDNLWQRSHSFGLTMQVAPQRPSDARVIAGTYVLPVDTAGDSLSIYEVHSSSQFANLPGMEGLGLLGNSDTLGTRLSMPLGNTATYAQSFSVGIDYKNIKQTTAPLQGGAGIDQPIHYAPLVGTYTANLFGQNRSTVIDVTATSGLRGLLGNNDTAFENKRSGTSASYLVLRTGLQHTRSLSRWSLYGKLELQTSSGMLVPTEQYTAGGAESVRGYLESEVSGDRGARATFELRTPQIGLGGQGSAWRLSGLAHLDWARLTTLRQPGDVLPEVQRISSGGFGLKIVAPRELTVDLNAARAFIADPLRDSSGNVTGYTTRAGQWRGLARAMWAF